jgi:peptidyl-tRNA hydrolase
MLSEFIYATTKKLSSQINKAEPSTGTGIIMSDLNTFYNRSKLGMQLKLDVFRRFFHQLHKQQENLSTSFVLKDFFKSSDELATAIIDATVEALMSHVKLEDSRVSKLIDDLANEIVSIYANNSLESEMMNIDAIRNPHKIMFVLDTLCGKCSDFLTDAEIGKSDVAVVGEAEFGDFTINTSPITTVPYQNHSQEQNA